ncbi:MAG: glycosyltransferase family 4 protein [Myxococcota bacterium]
MRVLAVNQFYAPDQAATSQLLTELCEDLVDAGDEVTVVASPGNYLGGGDQLPPREWIRGVEVRRPWATRLGKGSIPRRLSDYTSFWASAVLAVARAQRPDVVLALTTPPMIAAGTAIVTRLRDVPLVTWVQDVYPDVAVRFGVVGARHPATLGLRAINRATYAHATSIVALSRGMAERLTTQGADPDKVEVIPNWSDSARLTPVEHADNPFRRQLEAQHGLPRDAFVAMYSGNLGAGHDIQTLVEAARHVDPKRIHFVFIGEGAAKAKARRSSRGLTHVHFLPYQPRESLAQSLSAADVHLASLRSDLAGLLVPSKLYGVMAVGRPLFYLGPPHCEVSEVIVRHEIGWVGDGSAVDLATALTTWSQDDDKCRRQGRLARAVFLRHYDRQHAVSRWRNVLDSAVRRE